MMYSDLYNRQGNDKEWQLMKPSFFGKPIYYDGNGIQFEDYSSSLHK